MKDFTEEEIKAQNKEATLFKKLFSEVKRNFKAKKDIRRARLLVTD